jgi:hypothetical protein
MYHHWRELYLNLSIWMALVYACVARKHKHAYTQDE